MSVAAGLHRRATRRVLRVVPRSPYGCPTTHDRPRRPRHPSPPPPPTTTRWCAPGSGCCSTERAACGWWPRRATSKPCSRRRARTARGSSSLSEHARAGRTISAIPRALAELPGTAIAVLTMEEDPAHARAALVVGAAGYALRKQPTASWSTRCKRLAAGETYLNPRLGGRLATARDDEDPEIGSVFAGHRIDAHASAGAAMAAV